METIASNLTSALPDHSDEENMYELLYLLGLTRPDLDGTKVFKKYELVPEKNLRFHINSAFRLKYFKTLQDD